MSLTKSAVILINATTRMCRADECRQAEEDGRCRAHRGQGQRAQVLSLFSLVTVFHKYCYIGFATSSSVSYFQHVMCFYKYPFCLCESIASDLECFFRMTDLCPVDRCCSLCRNAKIEACSLSILIIIQTYWCCISRFISHWVPFIGRFRLQKHETFLLLLYSYLVFH